MGFACAAYYEMSHNKVLQVETFLLRICREFRGSGLKPYFMSLRITQDWAFSGLCIHCQEVSRERGHRQNFIPHFTACK